MNRPGLNGSRNLAAACGIAALALAALALIAALASSLDWLRAAAAIPFVLVVPGCAIAAALFPPGSIDRADRVIYSFVFSVSAAALGGLIFQVAFDLGSGAWLGLLIALTIAASAVALTRRSKLPPRRRPERSVRPPAGPVWAIAFLVALAIAGVAIAIATEGVHEQQSRQLYVSLWALPAQSESGGDRVEIGIWNHGGPSAYRLEASSGGEILASRRLRLGPTERWRSRLGPRAFAGDGPLLITLYRGPTTYRSVELDLEALR